MYFLRICIWERNFLYGQSTWPVLWLSTAFFRGNIFPWENSFSIFPPGMSQWWDSFYVLMVFYHWLFKKIHQVEMHLSLGKQWGYESPVGPLLPHQFLPVVSYKRSQPPGHGMPPASLPSLERRHCSPGSSVRGCGPSVWTVHPGANAAASNAIGGAQNYVQKKRKAIQVPWPSQATSLLCPHHSPLDLGNKNHCVSPPSKFTCFLTWRLLSIRGARLLTSAPPA